MFYKDMLRETQKLVGSSNYWKKAPTLNALNSDYINKPSFR